MVWSKKNKDPLTNITNPVGGGIRSNKRLTHTNQPTLLTTLKHLSILSIITSLLLVLTINIYRTYSYTNTLTKAVESTNQPTQSESTNQTSSSNNTNTTCNSSNPNAPVCIALSIKSSSSATGDSSLTMAIPEQGGIVTGSHTIDITTNSYSGWRLYMEVTDPNNQSSTGSTNTNKDANLINTTQQSSTNNPYTIASLPETAIPTQGSTTTLSGNNADGTSKDNTWGIAMPYGGYEDDFSPVTETNNPYKADPTTSEGQQTLSTTLWASPKYMSKHVALAARDGKLSITNPDTRTIYYGVRVDNPSTTPAGDYQAGIVYTAIASLPPSPTITTITPNTYTIGSNDPTTITIEGTNLATTYEVWIDLDKDDVLDSNNELCIIDKDSITDTKLTCTIPTPSSTLTINPDTYNLYLRTQANELATATFTYTTPPAGTVCRNADPYSDCKVDIDDNMIPIYYDGNTEAGEAIWKVANPTVPGQWYDYTNKQWANAVTITKEALDAKKYQNPDTTINNNDVLGYWVYIPRYAYEVQRPNAVDRVVAPQNFNIRFETNGDTKKTPASSCNLEINTDPENHPMWVEQPSGNNSTNASNAGPNSDNVLAKDYRTTCVNESGGAITRDYPDNNTELANGHTTWVTHPAFSWGAEEIGYTELNGIWVGKFETTGSAINPTILPNQKHIGYMNTLGNIGGYYTIAKYIGIYDPNNTGGNDVSLNGTTLYANNGEEWTSKHNLETTTSHMLKNSEWGAVAYLASSDYGAGIDSSGNSKVFNNAQYQSGTDGNGQSSKGVTGCGPYDLNGSTNTYYDGTPLNSTTIESPTACSTTNKERSYNGEIGVLASTTNNVYGIYDMAGGANEYVMGNFNSSNETYVDSYFSNPTKPPYVDIYLSTTDFSSSKKPGWFAAPSTPSYYYNDICTWGNCGGHALHETKLYQSVSGGSQSWGGDNSNFTYSNARWFLRGGNANNGSRAGLFYLASSLGISNNSYGFRTALFTQGAP